MLNLLSQGRLHLQAAGVLGLDTARGYLELPSSEVSWLSQREMTILEEEHRDFQENSSLFPPSILEKAKDLDSSAQQIPIFWPAFPSPSKAHLMSLSAG